MHTMDFTTEIVESGSVDGVQFSTYRNTDGKEWTVRGTCNACGLCEEFKPEYLGQTLSYTILRKDKDGFFDNWLRTVRWDATPGTPYACIEIGYENRSDIPMTSDLVNSIDGCSLSGD